MQLIFPESSQLHWRKHSKQYSVWIPISAAMWLRRTDRRDANVWFVVFIKAMSLTGTDSYFIDTDIKLHHFYHRLVTEQLIFHPVQHVIISLVYIKRNDHWPNDCHLDLCHPSLCTVPILNGDPKYSERGPKGDLILSKKGTKKGTQNSSYSKNQKGAYMLIFSRNWI